MAFDILQLLQTVPQQFIPYILLFGAVFFLISLTKVSWKIRLAGAAVGSVTVNYFKPLLLSPLMPVLSSMVSIGATLLLVVAGLLLGRKHLSTLPPLPKQSQDVIRNLEIRRSKLIAQLNASHGDIKKERQLTAQINAIDQAIRNMRAKLGVPV